jgi:ribosomal protein S18 acetylase RimI-like enzyme
VSELIISDFLDDRGDAVIALWQRCCLTRSWNDLAIDIVRKNINKNGKFLVGYVGQRLIASVMIAYDGHRGSVNYLAIDPDYSASGYGKAMMAEAERFLQSIGCPKINLCMRQDNDRVVSFYHQLGYATEPVVLLGKRLIKDD